MTPSPRSGFTLAEVAVTLAIVGLALLWVLEGLNRLTVSAGHAHNLKVARQLALRKLSEIEAGLYWEEIDDMGLAGSFAEDGFEEFQWEVKVGDDAFAELDPTLPFDALAEQRRREAEDDDDDDGTEAAEAYERVRIRITFPRLTDEPPELVLERWIPWEQVYGPEEDEGVEGDAP